MWAQTLSHVGLCDPMDCSPPGPSVHGIFQARIMEWAPAGDLPRPRIEPASPLSPASLGGFFISEPPGKLQGSRLGEPN